MRIWDCGLGKRHESIENPNRNPKSSIARNGWCAVLYFGCDYYPEQWSQWLADGEARWETDAALMAEAGFNVVRLAEFAWGLLEPEADRFDFAWLERAIAVLAAP